MRKEIKKLIAATMSMALVLGVGNMVNSSAAEKKIAYRAFSFKVESGYAATKNKGDTVKRTTNDVSNAWGVNFKTSDEPTKDNKKTYTIFYIAEVVKNEVGNITDIKIGKKLIKIEEIIQEGSGLKTYSAYRNVSPGPTALYAKDNKDGSREAYTITGTWSPQIGDTPENDGE